MNSVNIGSNIVSDKDNNFRLYFSLCNTLPHCMWWLAHSEIPVNLNNKPKI